MSSVSYHEYTPLYRHRQGGGLSSVACVLVYAYDRGAGARYDRAAQIIERLNVRRKAQRPISPDEARSLISDYLAWEPIVNDGALVLDAVDAEVRYRLSFWDALIIAAAVKGAADVILSEDLSDRQRFGSVEVRNPFNEL